jgi:hypothetical protein
MRCLILASVTAITMLPTFGERVALAADPTTADCLAAADRFADLRPQHKLREARDKLLICSAATCPGDVRQECGRRLDEINALMPTIVFETKDGAGNDIAAVRVTMDGQLLATRLEGVALSIDPGEHSFTFEVAGHAPVAKSIVIREGEKDRRERIVVGGAPENSATASISAAGELGQSGPAAPSRPHLLEWSLIGGGAAVAVAGAVFMAVEAGRTSDANSSHDRSGYDSALDGWRLALGATIVGAAAAATGGVLFALGTRHETAQGSRRGLWIGAGPGALQMGGTW